MFLLVLPVLQRETKGDAGALSELDLIVFCDLPIFLFFLRVLTFFVLPILPRTLGLVEGDSEGGAEGDSEGEIEGNSEGNTEGDVLGAHDTSVNGFDLLVLLAFLRVGDRVRPLGDTLGRLDGDNGLEGGTLPETLGKLDGNAERGALPGCTLGRVLGDALGVAVSLVLILMLTLMLILILILMLILEDGAPVGVLLPSLDVGLRVSLPTVGDASGPPETGGEPWSEVEA